MILGSFKIYTNVGKLEPATRNNLDRFGFGYRRAQDPRIKNTKPARVRILKGKKADPNPSRLGKSVLHGLKHKVKLKITRGNLMNLPDLAKIQ